MFERRYKSTSATPAEPYEEEEIEAGKGLALISYLPGLCLIGLLSGQQNRYVFHHAKQGFLLFLLEIAALLFRWNLIWDALLIVCAVLAVMGMVRAFSGRPFRVPFLSDWFIGLRG